jgi:hypothetical protein
MVEVEIYNSIREVGKNYGGRGVNKKLSPQKQRIANEIRTTRKWEQIIDCNFCEEDFFCRFSAPYGTFCEEKAFRREVNNFFKRIKRRCVKCGIPLKYIGFIECGKSGKNWHMHVILSKQVSELARACWHFPNGGINLTPLWQNHSYEKLADYIHKDVAGQKRMMASRNLARPVVEVRKCTRREVRKIERGEYMEPPAGFYLVKDDPLRNLNDITGASYYFKFRALAFRKQYK